MKFEDLLMQPSDQEKQRRVDLEEEVEKLQEELDAELKLSKILKCALQGPVHSCQCLSKLIPSKVQELIAELATLEEEIVWLERNFHELKSRLYLEKQQIKDHDYAKLSRRHRKQKKQLSYMQDDTSGTSKTTRRSKNSICFDLQMVFEKPNELSEEMIKCLIGVFLKLNRPSLVTKEGSTKHNPLHLINSKAFISKTSFSCKVPVSDTYNKSSSNMDHYGIFQDCEGPLENIAPYKGFIPITRNSLDTTRVSQCSQELGKFRFLSCKLQNVDLSILTYKQKLAFWINIYNACIMHAFLQHGFPSTEEKLLTIMNKAAMNVGGIVLNALAIEHFILRHPSEANFEMGRMDEKEKLLRHVYGLRYPEPYVTFALCRGSRSSPALRVYTANDVVNELERAKVEYLEASVGVTSKKKIIVPKLLEWHMRDFADDLESLLEWIYSQIPNPCLLKRSIMECLIGETKSQMLNMVQIQPYDSEFRYLLPL